MNKDTNNRLAPYLRSLKGKGPAGATARSRPPGPPKPIHRALALGYYGSDVHVKSVDWPAQAREFDAFRARQVGAGRPAIVFHRMTGMFERYMLGIYVQVEDAGDQQNIIDISQASYIDAVKLGPTPIDPAFTAAPGMHGVELMAEQLTRRQAETLAFRCYERIKAFMESES